MDFKFNLEDIAFQVEDECDVKIGKLNYEVTDLNLTEYLQVLREIPSLVREIRISVEEDLNEYTEPNKAMSSEEIMQAVVDKQMNSTPENSFDVLKAENIADLISLGFKPSKSTGTMLDSSEEIWTDDYTHVAVERDKDKCVSIRTLDIAPF